MQSEEGSPSNTLNLYHSQSNEPPSQQDILKAAISLSETMPPSKLRKNLIGLTSLAPQIQDILLEKVDSPLQIEESDPDHPFLKAEFNRDGDSYRSPHTNTYFPESEGGYIPKGELRRIEQLGNVLFGEYTKLYYGNTGVGSFFVSESGNPNQFSCGYFAKKYLDEKQGKGFGGSMDSFNVVDVDFNGDEANFNLQTTILIEMDIKDDKQGSIDMTGFLKQKKSLKKKIGKQRYEDALVIVGEMIEELETVMRQSLEGVYIIRTKETIFSTRYEYTVEYERQRRSLAEGLKQIHLRS